MHKRAFGFTLAALAERGRLEGKTIAVDATTLGAKPTMRSSMHFAAFALGPVMRPVAEAGIPRCLTSRACALVPACLVRIAATVDSGTRAVRQVLVDRLQPLTGPNRA